MKDAIMNYNTFMMFFKHFSYVFDSIDSGKYSVSEAIISSPRIQQDNEC
jgi:hypothetical protein